MTWATPWAWVLAAGVVLPLVAHLWSRREPRAVDVPTLRFLQVTSPVSRRLRHLQDRPLLALRMIVVLLVAAAAAGPRLTSSAPSNPERVPLHRVVVVDEAVRDVADDAVARLRQDAAGVEVLAPAPVSQALGDAVARAARAPRDSRREIAIVWDGTRPALDARDLARIPADLGVRLEVLSPAPPFKLAAPRADAITIDAAPSDATAARQLRDRLATLRLPSPSTRVRLAFAGASPGSTPPGPDVAHGGARMLADVADDPRVREASTRSPRDTRPNGAAPGSSAMMSVAFDGAAAPLASAEARGDALTVQTAAQPSSPLPWWTMVVALEGGVRWERLASTPWSRADVARAARPPAVPGPDAPGPGTTRLVWAAVLALLLAESWWRRRRQGEGRSDAA